MFGCATISNMIKKLPFLFTSILIVSSLLMSACSSTDTYGLPPSLNYYTSHLEDKLYTINQIDEQNDISFSFAFVTDLHIEYNTNNSATVLKAINKQYPLDKVVLGGDYISNDYKDINEAKSLMKECIRPFTSFNYTAIIGNHDSNNNSNVGTPQIPDKEIYSIINNKEEQYPYSLEKDEKNKICLFYLDSGTGKGSFSDEDQQLFLYDNLMRLDDTWSVLIFIHIIFDGTYENNNLSVIQDCGSEFVDYLNSFYTDLKCNLIGVFSGHSHLDHMDNISYPCTFVTTMCDSIGVSNPDYNIYKRKKREITEQAFDIVQVDTTNRRVYLTRIGCGSDRSYSY